MHQRHTLDTRGRALARVAVAECFRRKLSVTTSLSEASHGTPPPRNLYLALCLEDLLTWSEGGWCLTGKGKSALIIQGIQLPDKF